MKHCYRILSPIFRNIKFTLGDVVWHAESPIFFTLMLNWNATTKDQVVTSGVKTNNLFVPPLTAHISQVLQTEATQGDEDD